MTVGTGSRNSRSQWRSKINLSFASNLGGPMLFPGFSNSAGARDTFVSDRENPRIKELELMNRLANPPVQPGRTAYACGGLRPCHGVTA
jgi:hypothetical protein